MPVDDGTADDVSAEEVSETVEGIAVTYEHERVVPLRLAAELIDVDEVNGFLINPELYFGGRGLLKLGERSDDEDFRVP